MSSIRTSLLIVALTAVTVVVVSTAQRPKPYTAPETFTSDIGASTAIGALASKIRIKIDRYTPEPDQKALIDALTSGGYPQFLHVLGETPVVGQVVIGDEMFSLRFARETPTDKGRNVTLVTDKPIYFVGGGRADAKSRAGFDMGVVELTLDDYGLGTGRMAAAAKVRPDGKGGVILDDYADEPIRLSFVSRERQ